MRAAASVLVTAAVAATVLLTSATPAAAHTRASAASNLDSRITAVPDHPGIAWRTYAGGDLLEVGLRGDVELVVFGYEGEPYLRLTPAGVEVNRNSPATYLNTERYADVALPPRADATAPAEWQQVSDRPTYAWHDHRVHWMAPERPPGVRSAPGTAQLVQPWTVEVTVDGQPQVLQGELWWVPGTSGVGWVALGLVLTAPALLGALRARRRTRRCPDRWVERPRLERVRTVVRPAAVVVAAVAAFNALHLVDDLLAWPAPTLDVLFGLLHTGLFVGAGLVGAAVAWHGTQGPFLSLGIAAGAVLFHQGLLQLPLLVASQLPTVWPAPLLRGAVALALAQALWVAVVLVAGMRVGAAPGVPQVPLPIEAAERPDDTVAVGGDDGQPPEGRPTSDRLVTPS